MQPRLDARLAAVAALVRPGCVCADIGCDHGLLSAWLACQHRCKKVIACDVRPGPLQTAQRNFARYGCTEEVECRLGNGLSVLAPNEVDDIVIAGVSGVTVGQILAQAPEFWHSRHRFLFVPASKDAALRHWLYANGFALLSETPVLAAGRCYTVMRAAYTGEACEKDTLFCEAGLANTGTAAARAYLQKTARRLTKEGKATRAREVEAWL